MGGIERDEAQEVPKEFQIQKSHIIGLEPVDAQIPKVRKGQYDVKRRGSLILKENKGVSAEIEDVQASLL